MEIKEIMAYFSRVYLKYLLQGIVAYFATFSIINIIMAVSTGTDDDFFIMNPLFFLMGGFIIVICSRFNKEYTYLVSQSFSRENIIKGNLISQGVFLLLGTLICAGIEKLLYTYTSTIRFRLIPLIQLRYGEGSVLPSFLLTIIGLCILVGVLFIILQMLNLVAALVYPLSYNEKIIFIIGFISLLGFAFWLVARINSTLFIKLIIFIFGAPGRGEANPLYPLICLPLIAIGISLLIYFVLRKTDLNTSI